MPYKSIRDNFTHQIAVILSCYRKHCSSQSPAGQLILPESLKLLPMYSNCLLKSDALLSRMYTVCVFDSTVFVFSLQVPLPTPLGGGWALHPCKVDV